MLLMAIVDIVIQLLPKTFNYKLRALVPLGSISKARAAIQSHHFKNLKYLFLFFLILRHISESMKYALILISVLATVAQAAPVAEPVIDVEHSPVLERSPFTVEDRSIHPRAANLKFTVWPGNSKLTHFPKAKSPILQPQ
jgi:hypothetical protein